MPTAHLIHGFLGAGKTTFARRLAAGLGAVRYSPDEWMVARHGVDPPKESFARHLDDIYAEIDALWPHDLARGVDVVLDFGFWTRASRDDARRRAREAGAGFRLYALRCSEAVARERCRRRNERLDGSLHIAENTFDVLKARFEPLGADEPFELIESVG